MSQPEFARIDHQSIDLCILEQRKLGDPPSTPPPPDPGGEGEKPGGDLPD